MFLLIFLSSFIPALITAVALFYLIFNITAQEVGFPEAIMSTLMPAAERVVMILALTLPAVFIILLVFAYHITHRMVGPFDRIIRELEETVKGQRKGPIKLRREDTFGPLVHLINKLL